MNSIALVSLIVLIVTILIGFFRKMNVGLVAILAVTIFGTVIGVKDSAIIGGFSSSLFIMLLGVSFLCAVGITNGALELMAKKFLRLSGGRAIFAPILLWIIGFGIAAIGPGCVPALGIVAALALPLGKATGYDSTMLAIIEVGPRDGFQSVKTDCCEISTELKKEIIDGLFAAGVQHMEYSSFVSPKAIPQLADVADVTKYVLEKYGDKDLFPLVPNFRGAENAHTNGVKKIVYVVSMSKSHNKANINRTHEESFEEYKKIGEAFPDMQIILDLATAFGCPFEGKYRDTEMPVRFLKDYVDAGMDCCCLCDTIGIADPTQVKHFMPNLMEV